MKSYQIADLFCGAGGTSSGAVEAVAALGRHPQVTAVNHWPVAIATHTSQNSDVSALVMAEEARDIERGAA